MTQERPAAIHVRYANLLVSVLITMLVINATSQFVLAAYIWMNPGSGIWLFNPIILWGYLAITLLMIALGIAAVLFSLKLPPSRLRTLTPRVSLLLILTQLAMVMLILYGSFTPFS